MSEACAADQQSSAVRIPLRFTAEDADRAFDAWGSNCGPGAIAAITGLTLDELRPNLGDFESKRYTNPTLMWEVLKRLGLTWRLVKPPRCLPNYGLARVQWAGPWTEPGVPARAAYRHTHWVAAQWCEGLREFAIFDINAITSGGWILPETWSCQLVPWLLENFVPRASGAWSLTHVVEIDLAGSA